MCVLSCGAQMEVRKDRLSVSFNYMNQVTSVIAWCIEKCSLWNVVLLDYIQTGDQNLQRCWYLKKIAFFLINSLKAHGGICSLPCLLWCISRGDHSACVRHWLAYPAFIPLCVGKTRGNILSGKDNHVYKYLSSVSLLFDFEAIVYKIYLAKYNSYTF